MIINNFRQENDSIIILFFPILRNVKFLINSDPEKTTKKLLKLKRYFSNNFHKYFWVSQIISMQLYIFKMSCKKNLKKGHEN